MIILLQLGLKHRGFCNLQYADLSGNFQVTTTFTHFNTYYVGAAHTKAFHPHVLHFPARTFRQRGQGVLEESEVYLLQRGHFALAVGRAITLYEDSSRISPPVKKKKKRLLVRSLSAGVVRVFSSTHEVNNQIGSSSEKIQMLLSREKHTWNSSLTFQVNQKGPFDNVCICRYFFW